MAFGISAKHSSDLPLENLTPVQFIAVAADTIKRLGWNPGPVTGSTLVAYTPASMSSWGEEIKIIIQENAANVTSRCTGNQLTDWGKNKTNVASFLAAFNELKAAYTDDMLAERVQEISVHLEPANETAVNPIGGAEKMDGFLAIFKPTQDYFVTPILILINLFIFVLMISTGVHWFAPESTDLLNWGANFKPLTLHGEWWRLITACFLHIGVLHLLVNMYALLYIGMLLEPLIGRTRFAMVYLLTGIVSSAASLWWNSMTISAGASGAIFGMYGVFLAMLTTNFIDKSARKSLLTSIGVFVVFNLMNGAKGGIDNAAHIGGLLSGLAIGYLLYFALKNPQSLKLRNLTLGAIILLALTSSYTLFRNAGDHILTYEEGMKQFGTMETAALEVYNMPANTPADEILHEIKDSGIYYWNKNIELLEDLNELDLPIELHDQNLTLIEYCELRIESYEFLYKAVEENTTMYDDTLSYYNTQIEAIITSLGQPQ